MTKTYRLIASSTCVAIGVVLPIVFHSVGFMGSVFLPMHIPVLIAGLFLGARAGFITGVFTPLISTLVTGMPPMMPVLPIMIVELGVYGFIAGYCYEGKRGALYSSLLTAMAAGRIAAGFAVYGLALLIELPISPLVYLQGALIAGAPGIIIQLALIPLIIHKLQKAWNFK